MLSHVVTIMRLYNTLWLELLLARISSKSSLFKILKYKDEMTPA